MSTESIKTAPSQPDSPRESWKLYLVMTRSATWMDDWEPNRASRGGLDICAHEHVEDAERECAAVNRMKGRGLAMVAVFTSGWTPDKLPPETAAPAALGPEECVHQHEKHACVTCNAPAVPQGSAEEIARKHFPGMFYELTGDALRDSVALAIREALSASSEREAALEAMLEKLLRHDAGCAATGYHIGQRQVQPDPKCCAYCEAAALLGQIEGK